MWKSPAMDKLTICRRIMWGWGFLDQENSSTARYTSKPISRMAWAMPLWDRVKGSKVPGKKAIFRGWEKAKGPLSNRRRAMKRLMWARAEAR